MKMGSSHPVCEFNERPGGQANALIPSCPRSGSIEESPLHVSSFLSHRAYHLGQYTDEPLGTRWASDNGLPSYQACAHVPDSPRPQKELK